MLWLLASSIIRSACLGVGGGGVCLFSLLRSASQARLAERDREQKPALSYPCLLS